MIENAGAYVLLPRERDINPNEVIVDNDTNDGGQVYSQPYYKEKNRVSTLDDRQRRGIHFRPPRFPRH